MLGIPAFDPSRFAMQSTGAEEFGTRKIRSVISVNKPGKMEWVRLFDHVDYLIPGAALLDLQDGGRMYLVVPEIAAQLEDDVGSTLLHQPLPDRISCSCGPAR